MIDSRSIVMLPGHEVYPIRYLKLRQDCRLNTPVATAAEVLRILHTPRLTPPCYMQRLNSFQCFHGKLHFETDLGRFNSTSPQPPLHPT